MRRGFAPALGSQSSALVVGALLPVAAGPPVAFLRGAVARAEVMRGALTDADVSARYAAESAPFLHVLSAAQATPSCLGGSRTIVQVPVRLARAGTGGLLGYSVTIHWSSELQLSGSPQEGEFLAGTAPTFFQVTSVDDHTIIVDDVRLGQGCSAPAAGDLFRLGFSAAAGSGTGSVRVLSATLRDCTNQPQAVDLADPLAIPIDGDGPAAVSALTATAVDVPGSATRAMRLVFVPPADAESVTVYRAPFGGYPEYDDVAGVGAPPVPSSDPPAITIGTANLAAPAPERPLVLALSEPAPNPSRADAVFALSLPHAGPVSLLLYDLQGRRVRTLMDAVLPPGEQRVIWDGRDGDGHPASPGVYFARLWTPMGAGTRRVVRIR